MTNQNNNSNHSKDGWPPDFSNFLEAIALSFEDFLGEVNQTFEEVAETFQQELSQEIDFFWQDFVIPLMELEIDWESRLDLAENLTEDSDIWLNPKIEATANTYPACMGCINYHGGLYNGTVLVCGIHPFGVEGSLCLDWEKQQH